MLGGLLPGFPSLHGIIEAIANGFLGALASALVPDFLKHASVATIQALVSLPDPATWPHVSQLQGEMTFLGVLLLPVTLAAGTFRYWLIGMTGGPGPGLAVGRATCATGVLVAYRWVIEQTVAAANTLTHAILAFPAVSGGLSRIVTVLFGGALLVGAGGVFGALLVIVGVVFAAAMFAAQVLVTLVLALLVVAGPPLIAISAIPELAHLARSWAHALLAVALIPVGWTVLFATAGALALDASSFTGGAGGLPEHVAAAFAGLITFVLAVRLPIVLFARARHLMFAPGSAPASASPGALPGVERVRASRARLRSAALDAAPAVGRAVGVAAGALGAPADGPVGALRRSVGRLPRTRSNTEQTASRTSGPPPATSRQRGRVRLAAAVLRDAPRQARAAMRPVDRTASSRDRTETNDRDQIYARRPSSRASSSSATGRHGSRVAFAFAAAGAPAGGASAGAIAPQRSALGQEPAEARSRADREGPRNLKDRPELKAAPARAARRRRKPRPGGRP